MYQLKKKILDQEELLKGNVIGHPEHLRLILINYAIYLYI